MELIVKKAIALFGLMTMVILCYAQYPNNEDGQYEDMLTPDYYNTINGGAFRLEINKYVHFARLHPFHHPLEDSIEQIPVYTINRSFGDGIGPGGTGSHHPAFDYYIGNSTQVNLYAAHEGIVTTSRDVDRYRHYLSITTDIKDSLDNILGKMVTLYAHIDLDLDSTANINLNGQFVNKGDIVSKHLYSGTMGGPHLHFEIRYYRSTDSGTEDFYGGNTVNNTLPSSGSWTYGFWNPNYGYGFANPENHLNQSSVNIVSNDIREKNSIFPNPVKDIITIELCSSHQELSCLIYNLSGQIVMQKDFRNANILKVNLANLNSGVYILQLIKEGNNEPEFYSVIKE